MKYTGTISKQVVAFLNAYFYHITVFKALYFEISVKDKAYYTLHK